jgi:signal transduction histidine kinase
VRADPDRLQQVLLNLLTNAIKFTPQGGTVSMEAVPTEYRVHLRVHDTGIGIAAEDQAQIFDPFIQGADEADAGSEGVGLGLAISQDLTTAMDGTLSVDSEPGQGATFTITLPQSDPPPSSGTTESPTRSASG